MNTKICSKCKIKKSVKEFYKHKLHKDKLQIWCKLCCKYQRKIHHKKYYRKNKKKIIEYVKRYYQKHKEQKLKYYKKWLKENKFKVNQWQQLYYIKNIKKILKQKKLYYKTHKKYLSQYNKQYRKIHKKQIRNNYLKKKYKLTLKIYKKIYKKQLGKCAICEKIDKNLVIDHNHKKGEIRELLCHNCNTMLGLSKENLKTLYNSIKYLKRYK